MGGSAVLGTNFIDASVIGLADELRGDLHPDFGVRQFRVYTVRRTYPTGTIGDGDYTDVETEITPQPLVESWMGGLGRDLQPCGIDEAGLVKLREVSLTYTEAELTGGSLAAGIDWLIKIIDAHGQAISARYFTISRPPYPDRMKDIGWILELERASDGET